LIARSQLGGLQSFVAGDLQTQAEPPQNLTKFFTVIGIDAAIEREVKQRKSAAAAMDFATKKTQP
jgi:hypothetical protein